MDHSDHIAVQILDGQIAGRGAGFVLGPPGLGNLSPPAHSPCHLE
jgi:hypothetical protein